MTFELCLFQYTVVNAGSSCKLTGAIIYPLNLKRILFTVHTQHDSSSTCAYRPSSSQYYDTYSHTHPWFTPSISISIVCTSFCNYNLLSPQYMSSPTPTRLSTSLSNNTSVIQATPRRIRMLNLPTCIIYFILCSVKRTLLLTIGSNFTNLNFSGVCVTLRRVV